MISRVDDEDPMRGSEQRRSFSTTFFNFPTSLRSRRNRGRGRGASFIAPLPLPLPRLRRPRRLLPYRRSAIANSFPGLFFLTNIPGNEVKHRNFRNHLLTGEDKHMSPEVKLSLLLITPESSFFGLSPTSNLTSYSQLSNL